MENDFKSWSKQAQEVVFSRKTDKVNDMPLKFVSTIFYQIFLFYQMIALQKLWKMFFISSKKLFSFLRYSNFSIFVFPSLFSMPATALKVDSRKNLEVYNIIKCLYKNLITHFVWYLGKERRCDIETLPIDRVFNTEHFYGKIMQKNKHQKLAETPF